MAFATLEDKIRLEQEADWAARDVPATIFGFLSKTAERFPERNAISFQLFSGPKDKAETLSWAELRNKVAQTANLFRDLGVGETDVVAYLLPTANETVLALLGGATAGIVNPINPLLEPEQIAAILRETGAKVLVTLKSFPKADVAQKAAEAARLAPGVQTIVEVDLLRYLTPPKSWIVPLVRPKNPVSHKARVIDFHTELAKHNTSLDFPDSKGDRIAAYFHTGGTTGMPKVAQHNYSGMIYNGWCGGAILFDETDVLICPLPLFHVMAAYPVLMSAIHAGAHFVMPTPQGYRGEGVFDNFWKLIERWGVTFLVTVPTAVSALMQRPVDADLSTLKTALSGSAPMPVELFNRFRKATGVEILEGYGLTEATCIVSFNPIEGEKRIGSVGLPMPYTDVRILDCDGEGGVKRACDTDEVGEICIASPGVLPGRTYTEADKNQGLFADGTHLRTGDLGRIDAQGYLWITGRAKDLIIRGGHNIDPAIIEEALMGHPDVAFAGAIGQPDIDAGELPCVYVELVEGAESSEDTLLAHAKEHIPERAAHPKYLEILKELPKTAVGKVFKPDLRRVAITRIYSRALADAGIPATVATVREDKKRGLIALVRWTGEKPVDEAAIREALGGYIPAWDLER